MKLSKESKALVAALKNIADPQRWTPPKPIPAPAKPDPKPASKENDAHPQ